MPHTQTAYRKARRMLRQRWSNWRQRQRLGQSQFQVETLEPRVLLSAENLFAMTYGAGGQFNAAQTVDVDENFNSWVGGSILGTVDLDPRGSEILRSSTHTNGSAMLAKYDPAGNPLFVADFQGSGSVSNIVGVKVTDDGVYVAGNFGGQMDLDPTDGVELVTSASSSQDIFVLKLSHDGDLLWSATFGGISTESVHALDVDADGNVVIAGTHNGSSDYDPFAGDTTGFGSASHGFVAMIDSDGELAWSQRFVADSTVSNSFAQFNGVSFDPTDGSVVAVGSFMGNITVDPDDENSIISAHANNDALLVRLNATGQLVDHYVVAGEGNEYYTDVAISNDGVTYLAGVFTNTVDLNPSGSPVMLNWDGPTEFSKPFFQAIDTDGNMQGLAVQTSEGEARGITLVDLPEGGYVMVGTGYFVGTADFEPDPGLPGET